MVEKFWNNTYHLWWAFEVRHLSLESGTVCSSCQNVSLVKFEGGVTLGIIHVNVLFRLLVFDKNLILEIDVRFCTIIGSFLNGK